MDPIRNRIKAHRRVRAGDLVPHEPNFRRHPHYQQRARRALYEGVGFARSLLAYELPDGRLKLLDGHLHRDLDPDMEVEVEVRHDGFVLPIRLDDTDIPGISTAIAYLDGSRPADDLADIIATKLLLRRLSPTEDEHHGVRVSDYAKCRPVLLTAGVQEFSSPLAQTHLELNCSIALARCT